VDEAQRGARGPRIRGSISHGQEISFLFRVFRGDLGPTHYHVQCVQIESLMGEKREAGEFLSPWADFKSPSSCASKPPLQINYVVITYSHGQVYI